jgi:catechol 2,3-dioxygenase-like lactoylglutathione lyase family enzyme
MRLNYVVIFVTDMARAVAFYRDVIGLPLRFQSPGWSEMALDGAMLALHTGTPAPAREGAEGIMTAGQCRPDFGVSDLDAFHARMTERNVDIVRAPREVFGARSALYRDPDGIVISVTEVK